MEFPFVFPNKDKFIQTKSHEITESERELGLETSGQRALEASLFIDKKFLDVALITETTKKPEELFGREAWDGYLNARVLSREYGNSDLTLDFIQKLHEEVTKPSNPNIAGKIRNIAVRGGDYNDPNKPVSYTQEEIGSVKENAYLTFQPEVGDTIGFIYYPFSKEGNETGKYITDLLREVCDWYNSEKSKQGADPYVLAAQLQRKIVSIHPFLDANGTVSRILMNWSLENSGVAPSALDNPSSDILTSEDDWIKVVKRGSEKYAESRLRLYEMRKTGVEDIAYILGMGPEKAFYEYIYKYLKPSPDLFSGNGGTQDHKAFEEFFREFLQELQSFQSFLQTTTKIGDKTITQGGLISSAYIKLSGRQNPVSPEMQSLFFSNINIFRGGSLGTEEIDDIKMCRLMFNFTAVGTGYRALEMSHLPAMASVNVDPLKIKEAMEYYNKMISKLYFKKRHPHKIPYPDDVRDLEQTIAEHVAGGSTAWSSPFASTSFSRAVSENWAKNHSGYGVLFVASAPKEGVVLSFGKSVEGIKEGIGIEFERECLVAGGINPNSIQEAIIYNKGKPSFVVRKDASGQIIINDVTGDFVIQRTYAQANGVFIFISETHTETPSKQLIGEQIEEEPVHIPSDYKPIKPSFDFLELPLKENVFFSYEEPHEEKYQKKYQKYVGLQKLISKYKEEGETEILEKFIYPYALGNQWIWEKESKENIYQNSLSKREKVEKKINKIYPPK